MTFADLPMDNPGPGHNAPPDDATILRERLAEDAREITRRRDELLAALERLPERCDDDDQAGRLGDFVKQLAACGKAAEAMRVARKEPFLAQGRVVDGFFKVTTDAIAKAKAHVEARLLGPYLRAKAEAARREQEEAARRAREEAERQAAQARTDADLQRAVETEAQAIRHEEAAAAKPAEHARTRGDFGAVATLRTEWRAEIVEREKLDLEALRPYFATADLEKALRAAVKAGARSIAGARIYEAQLARVS